MQDLCKLNQQIHVSSSNNFSKNFFQGLQDNTKGNNTQEQVSSDSLQASSIMPQYQTIHSEIFIGGQSFSLKSGKFSQQSIIFFKGKIVFVKKIVSEEKNEKQIFENELNIIKKIQGKKIALDIISYDQNSYKLYLLAGDKDLKTIKEIVKDEHIYKDSDAYEQFVIEIYIQLIDRLRRLHKLGIGHSDIKPSNIMMGYDGQIYLADFGASAFLDEENLHKYFKYCTKGFNFKDLFQHPIQSKEEAEVCDFTQLILTILSLYVFDDISTDYFNQQQFSECINYLLKLEMNKNSQFLPNLKILIEFYQHFDINKHQQEPEIFVQYLNHDVGLFDKFFDFQYSNEGIIFIKYIRDENLPLIAFLCKQNQVVVELQNKCKIRISCELQELSFLMEKLNISEIEKFYRLYSVDYIKVKQEQKTNQLKELTNTIPFDKQADLEPIQQSHQEFHISSKSLSRNQIPIENNNKELQIHNYQEQHGKFADEGKYIAPQELFDELFDLLEYIIKKIIIQIIDFNNQQLFQEQEYMYLDFKTYQTHRQYLNHYFLQLNIDPDTLSQSKILISLSSMKQIDRFIEKHHPQQLVQLIQQNANKYPDIKYYQVFYDQCEINQTNLKSIFLYEVAKFLENNKSKIKVYLNSYDNCLKRENFCEDNNLIPEIMFRLATTYEKDSYFNKALEFHFKINNFFENIQIKKNSELIMKSKTSIAFNLKNVGRLRQSIYYLQKALDYSNNIKNNRQIQVIEARIYSNMAKMLSLLKSPKLAKEISEKGLKLRFELAKSCSQTDQKLYALSLRNYGIMCLQYEPNKKILQNFIKAFEIYVNCGDFYYFRSCLIDLTNGFLKTQQQQYAQKFIHYAFTFHYTPEKLLEKSILEMNKKKFNEKKVFFNKKKDVISYLEDIQQYIGRIDKNCQSDEQKSNDKNNKRDINEDKREFNNLDQLQFELDFECGEKNKLEALQKLEKCAEERETMFGGQYNMIVFQVCDVLQNMCYQQKIYEKSLYYSRKLLQILFYLNNSDNCSHLENNQFPNFYEELIIKTLADIISLYEKISEYEQAEKYKQLKTKFSRSIQYNLIIQ